MRQGGSDTKVNLILEDGNTYNEVGTLNYTASKVDSSTGMVPMRATFPNPKSILLPGQFVRVQVTIGEREAYLVPQAALSQTEQGQILYTIAADNSVAPRPVVTDGWWRNDWVVTEGLKPGDKIIIDNLMKLRPGAPVTPHAPGESPGAPSGNDGKTSGKGKPDSDKSAKHS